MKMADIKVKAKKLKMKNISKMKKNELIWAVQQAEGNSDCFTRIPDCGLTDCCFRDDCL